MIAFSCVHCGQKMKVTEEDGGKKATCPKCGQTVALPEAGSGVRRFRRGKATAAQAAQPTTQFTPPPADSDVDTRTGSQPPIHDLPTRIERGGGLADSLTGFLAPAEGVEEIGRLGGYRVLEVIGAGGMGVVFKALDPKLERVVALKAMLPTLAASATARQRFLREARAAAAIQHDHIVTIYAVEEDRGVPFLAMPFLHGETLDARLRRLGGPLAVPEVVRIGREIADGLAAIHARGLIHRDIKPANVWLEGESGRVKILDFGLARASAGEIQLTQEGSIVGSPAYMAPEQASRQPVDHRADLFSLGCVLYVMATGALPFEGDDALMTLMAITTAEPTEPRMRNPALPAALAGLIMRLLAKKSAERPGSAREVIAALRAVGS
jgi:serine/threonine protein kinase/DNA-directed RNA polymerase subunit RPC12/RpoP